MSRSYDDKNIFNKIINRRASAEIVYESSHVICFKDIYPKAPVHILIIPKKKYIDIYDFSSEASTDEKNEIFHSFRLLIEKYNLIETGSRIITNSGKNGRQEVPHMHFHLIGGKDIGKMTT